jgi:acetyltransferase-like isoleucine patch superfamily enzyme
MYADTIISAIFGIPKTLYMNFKYLKFKQAIKLPIIVSNRVWLKETKGKINIDAPIKFAMIRFGFLNVDIFDKKRSRSIIALSGVIRFKGKAMIGHGSKLCIKGELILGNNFIISAESSIICYKRIEFGDNCGVSWENLIMDTDIHTIEKIDGKTNSVREIKFGNNVWIGCRCTILKGSSIDSNVVLAAGSHLHGKINGNNQIVGGNPVSILKTGIAWKA